MADIPFYETEEGVVIFLIALSIITVSLVIFGLSYAWQHPEEAYTPLKNGDYVCDVSCPGGLSACEFVNGTKSWGNCVSWHKKDKAVVDETDVKLEDNLVSTLEFPKTCKVQCTINGTQSTHTLVVDVSPKFIGMYIPFLPVSTGGDCVVTECHSTQQVVED